MNKKYYLLLIPALLLFAAPAYAYPAGTTHDYGQYQCSGPVVMNTRPVTISDADQEGSDAQMYAGLVSEIDDLYYGDTTDWNDPPAPYPVPPADFIANPQNYCIDGDSVNVGSPAPSSHTYKIKLHSGSPLTGYSLTYTPNGTKDMYDATIFTVAAPTVTLTANPTSVVSGSASSLSWTSTNATSCTATNFSNGGQVNSSAPVSTGPLTTNTTYSIYCTGPGGTSPTSTATVTVTAPPTPTATLTTQNSTHSITIAQGSSTNFNYTCTGAATASVSPTIGSVTVQSGTTGNVTPGVGTTPYTLTCTNPASSPTSASDTVYVTVTAALPNLTVNKPSDVTDTIYQPITLTGTINNVGSGTANNFPNVIQVCDYGCTTVNNTTAITSTVSSLGPNNNFTTISGSYTPTTGSGTQLYYRVCANTASYSSYNPPFTSPPSISETTTGDNCSDYDGGWSYLTVQEANPTATIAPTLTTTAGVSTNITAHITNAGNATTVNTSGNPSYFYDTFWLSTSPNMLATGNLPNMSNDTDPFNYGGGYNGVTTSWPSGVPNGYAAGSGEDIYNTSYTFPHTGTYYIIACADRDINDNPTVPESNTSDDCSSVQTVTVNSAPLPDIQGDPTQQSPVSTTQGQSTPLSDTVKNIGAAAAGAFPNIAQVCDNTSCTGSIDTVFTATGVSSLGINATASVSASYTPSTATPTLYYRFCGNETPTGSNSFSPSIAESQTNNNCGAWDTLTVTPAAGPTVSCSPNINTVVPGQLITWTANSSGFTSTPTYTWTSPSATPNAGNTGSTYGARYYTSPGTYQTSVSATNGSQTVNNQVCLPQVTVSAPSVTLTAKPDRVQPGTGGVVLSWTSSGLTDPYDLCRLSANDGLSATGLPSSSPNYPDPNVLTAQTKYTIFCSTGTALAPGTDVSSSATVNIVPKFVNF